MPIAAEIESQLLEQALLEAKLVLEPWFGEERLRENLAIEIARDLEAAARGNGVRLIEVPESGVRGECWMIVRFGKITSPAPTAIVRHRSFAIRDEQVGQRIARAVSETLGPDAAQRVLVFTHGGDAPPSSRINTHYVAGLIDTLHLPEQANGACLRLEAPRSLEFYDVYQQWYETFWRRRPHLTDIWIEPREVLAHCLEQGGLRLVYAEDVLCGLLAAERRTEFGLAGWRMRERVTAPELWGRGISSDALLAFARSLAHEERDAIWGTIVPANTSSLTSAMRIGRRIVGSLHEVAC